MRVLAGDVGGTNARLAVVDVTGPQRARIVVERRYASAAAAGLAPLVHRLLDETGLAVERACFGIACPVVRGRCEAPNLPWSVDERELGAALGLERTRLINDFLAAGHGLPALVAEDLVTLQAGEPQSHGPVALIGAGTGLGEGFLLWRGDRYDVFGSEGGHSSFAPTTPELSALLEWLVRRYGHVSCERVVSGPGLVNVYEFVVASGLADEEAPVRAEMQVRDPAAVIASHAIDRTNGACVHAMQLFATAFGAQAGNLALTVLATGGVYLGGGIAPRIVAALQWGEFVAALRHKGRLSGFTARVPVHVIMNPDVAIYGAATVAARD